ncbi:MAG: O-antigen ligase family protein [Gammaproteobacteria bacterium]|nr:O-antigen ligase family protein [Gammaproteobacteria bacterium]
MGIDIHWLKLKATEGGFAGMSLFILLFLFPLLSLSVRHWLSGIFSVLVLLGLFYAWRSVKDLYREEKILFAIFGFYIFSILLSSTVTGWSESSFHRLGTEFKYMMFFPVYMYIRQYSAAWRGFLLAIPLGAIVLGMQAIYDVMFQSMEQASGIYGPIIFGDFAVILAGISLIFVMTNRNWFWRGLNFAAAVMALIAVLYSGSRNAWLAISLILVIIPFMVVSRSSLRQVIMGYLVFIPVIVFAVMSVPDDTTSRMEKATKEFNTYLSHEYKSEQELNDSSVGIRLELWRSAIKIFSENPVLGVGPGNMGVAMNELVERGDARSAVYRDPAGVRGIHVHNAYFEVLGTQGIIGIVVFLALLFYPLYIFIKNRSCDMRIASMGVVLMTCFIIFSLSEVPFVHDNFSSIFLIYLCVFFAWIMNAKYTAKQS